MYGTLKKYIDLDSNIEHCINDCKDKKLSPFQFNIVENGREIKVTHKSICQYNALHNIPFDQILEEN